MKEVKEKLLTASKSFVSKISSFLKGAKFEVQKDIQNMIVSSVLVTGVAILAGAIKIILTEVYGSDMGLSTVLLGSRTGEAISLGIGLTLIHYVLIGCTFLLSGIMFFLRNNSFLYSFQQSVLAQLQKMKNKNLLRNPTKRIKSVGSSKIKNVTKNTIKFRQASPKREINGPSVFQNANGLKTKTATRASRIFRWVNVNTTQKRKQTIIISVVAVSAILNVFFLSTISAQFFVKNDIYSFGTVQIQTQTAGLHVYTDSSCTVHVSSLPWGNISPGKSGSNIVYIKNEGTVPITLNLNTTDWSPTNAPDYISLNWNYNEQPLEPNRVILVRLTLTVSQNINGIESFDFQILINGTS